MIFSFFVICFYGEVISEANKLMHVEEENV